MAQVRRWCFTWNNPDEDGLYERVRDDGRIRRFIVGDEVSAGGTIHTYTRVYGVVPYDATGCLQAATPKSSLGGGSEAARSTTINIALKRACSPLTVSGTASSNSKGVVETKLG